MFSPVGYVSLFEVALEYEERFDSAWSRIAPEQEAKADDTSPWLAHKKWAEYVLFMDRPDLHMCGPNGVLLRVASLQVMESAELYWRAEWFPKSFKIWEYRYFFVEPPQLHNQPEPVAGGFFQPFSLWKPGRRLRLANDGRGT